MTDFIEEYEESVRKRLSRAESAPVERLAEVLCFPSFHPETLLRVTATSAGTKLRLATFTSSFWYAAGLTRSKMPSRTSEVAAVAPESAACFWDSVDQLNPETIQTQIGPGADGMSVQASYTRGDVQAFFKTWSPERASLSGRFVCLIYELAWTVLKEPVSIERLEQLHGYLPLGLPARLVPAEFTHLRFFGRLSSVHEDELRQLLESIPNERPLLLDMTNLEGMGTLLYPTFIEFVCRDRLTAWAVSEQARRHVESMGLHDPNLFDSIKAARAWISRQTETDDGQLT